MARKSISKSIRFEVFKRDKFTCQYCGKKAPDVVLHIDHIEPVSKGGDNGIVNLITSCYECNLGKSNKRLNDNSVVEKQRKQLELIQERREQMELMFKWKKSLSNLDDETVKMVKEYIEAKIHPHTISSYGENNLRGHLKKYGVNEVLDAIDVSATTYLRFSNAEGITQESVEMFLNKLGGILFNRKLSPIEQKIAYIKNNTKRRLGYFDPRRAAILLKDYAAALRKYWDYTDEQILKDLDNELIPNLEKEHNWSGWSAFIENWTASIKERINEQEDNQVSSQAREPENQTKSDLISLLNTALYDLEATISALVYMMKPFPNHKEQRFINQLYNQLKKFIEDSSEYSLVMFQKIDNRERPLEVIIQGYISDQNITHFTDYDFFDEKMDNWFFDKMNEAIIHVMEENFKMFYFSPNRFSDEDRSFLKDKSLTYIKEALEGKRLKLTKEMAIPF